jgi:hypothetical protein
MEETSMSTSSSDSSDETYQRTRKVRLLLSFIWLGAIGTQKAVVQVQNKRRKTKTSSQLSCRHPKHALLMGPLLDPTDHGSDEEASSFEDIIHDLLPDYLQERAIQQERESRVDQYASFYSFYL